MTPTADIRRVLRKRIGEMIPEGFTETDTRFLDTELDEVLLHVDSLDEAAADLWEVKAGLFQAEIGIVKSIRAGGEGSDLVTPKEAADYCLRMAAMYHKRANGGSFGVSLVQPEVI